MGGCGCVPPPSHPANLPTLSTRASSWSTFLLEMGHRRLKAGTCLMSRMEQAVDVRTALCHQIPLHLSPPYSVLCSWLLKKTFSLQKVLPMGGTSRDRKAERGGKQGWLCTHQASGLSGPGGRASSYPSPGAWNRFCSFPFMPRRKELPPTSIPTSEGYIAVLKG